jgi:hypothetical protein
MNTIKLILILTIPMAGIAFLSSCGKAPDAQESKKEAKASSAVNAADEQANEKKNSLEAIRDGQYASLNWHIGAPEGKINQIIIARNATGVRVNTRNVGELEPTATSFRDRLPDDNAYWYWVRLIMEKQKTQIIGPVRAAPDKAGSANYINPEENYKVAVTRSEDLATLRWDFPDDEYRLIKITRYPYNELEPHARGSAHVVDTLEWKSQCANALPDPNSDYWYWFRITLKSGVIVYRGPIKAEYAGQ